LILSSKLSILSSFGVRSVLLMLCFAAMPSIAQQDAAGLATIPPLVSPVIDTTDTLSADDRAQLEAQSLALQRSSGAQLQILLVPSTQPEDIAVYAQRVFDTWALGRAGIDDGLLIVVAKNDRRVRIHTGIGLEGRIPDATAQRLIAEYLTPKFKRGDVAGGLNDATLVLASVMNGEPLPASLASPERKNASSWSLLLAIMCATLAAICCQFASRSLSRGQSMVVTVLVAGIIGGFVSMNLLVALASVAIGAMTSFLRGLITNAMAVAVVQPSVCDPKPAPKWKPDDFVFDPNDPDVVQRRRERAQREAQDNDDESSSGGGWSSGGSSDGWSGGGGSSRGGGASGSW
jgi:uncharacterized protein